MKLQDGTPFDAAAVKWNIDCGSTTSTEDTIGVSSWRWGELTFSSMRWSR